MSSIAVITIALRAARYPIDQVNLLRNNFETLITAPWHELSEAGALGLLMALATSWACNEVSVHRLCAV